jgi:succinate-acetate transporter protein
MSDTHTTTTTRPISIPNPGAGDRRSRIGDMDPNKEKRQSMRVNGITISTELFEKMFLLPQRESKRGVLDNLGNPTPIGLLGIMLSLTPLACDLMGWRGSGGNGIASVGTYYWFGGLLLIIGGFLNFITGDTFSFVVFMAYGAFWLTYAYTLDPAYLAYGAYSPDPTNPALGLTSTGFNASYGFFLVFMGLLNLIFLICSLRTDITHVIAFSTLVLAFGLLTGQHFNIALGNDVLAGELQYVRFQI